MIVTHTALQRSSCVASAQRHSTSLPTSAYALVEHEVGVGSRDAHEHLNTQ
jgi:hypothetical protein